MDNDRKLVAVAISFPLLIEMMRQGYHAEYGIKCTDGVPPDATFVGSFTEGRTQTAYFIFQHDSFEPVPVGHELPTRDITLTASYQEEKA